MNLLLPHLPLAHVRFLGGGGGGAPATLFLFLSLHVMSNDVSLPALSTPLPPPPPQLQVAAQFCLNESIRANLLFTEDFKLAAKERVINNFQWAQTLQLAMLFSFHHCISRCKKKLLRVRWPCVT